MKIYNKKQIKKLFENHYPEHGKMYTREEESALIDEMESVMADVVRDFFPTEEVTIFNVCHYIMQLAEDKCFDKSEEFERFGEDLRKLVGRAVGLKNGFIGENKAQRELSILALDSDVVLKNNVLLSTNDHAAEYDSILITQYGIFVLEEKNLSDDMRITSDGQILFMDEERDVFDESFGKKMLKRKLLLKSLLDGEIQCDFESIYHGWLLQTHPEAKIIDQRQTKEEEVKYLSSILIDINEYRSKGLRLSKEDICRIESVISENFELCKQNLDYNKGYCSIKSEAIIDYFALFIEKCSLKKIICADGELDLYDDDFDEIDDRSFGDIEKEMINDIPYGNDVVDHCNKKKSRAWTYGVIAATTIITSILTCVGLSQPIPKQPINKGKKIPFGRNKSSFI